MKSSIRLCLSLALLALAPVIHTSPLDEPAVPVLVPPTNSLDAYDKALGHLEKIVDGYFHDALSSRVSVTHERRRQLDETLAEQSRLVVESKIPGLLTAREIVVRFKLAILRSLDGRFAGEDFPEDLERALELIEIERRSAVALLIEGGAL